MVPEKGKIGILRRTEKSMLRAISGVQFKERKLVRDVMLMLGLMETIDQLAMANSVRRYGHVLRREDGHVLRRAYNFEVEGEWENWRPKWTWRRQVKLVCMKVVLSLEDALYLL